jgi:hypothetical protein
MPTRGFYRTVSRTFVPYQGTLKIVLFSVWLGGFALVGVVATVLKMPALSGVLGRLWFTLCVLLGIIYLCTHWFNPTRDPLDASLEESWSVIFINLSVLLTAWMWFWED